MIGDEVRQRVKPVRIRAILEEYRQREAAPVKTAASRPVKTTASRPASRPANTAANRRAKKGARK
jgi:hypothetical protein